MISPVIVQGIGFTAVCFSLCIFQTNSRKKMLQLGMLAAMLYTVHFFLLGALTGSAMNLTSVARSYIYYKVTPSRRNSWIMVGFMVVATAAAILTWQGPLSLLPMIATLSGGYAYWQKDTTKIRRLALISSPLWFTYNFISGSYPGMMIECIMFTSNLVGQYRFDLKKSKLDRLLRPAPSTS